MMKEKCWPAGKGKGIPEVKGKRGLFFLDKSRGGGVHPNNMGKTYHKDAPCQGGETEVPLPVGLLESLVGEVHKWVI